MDATAIFTANGQTSPFQLHDDVRCEVGIQITGTWTGTIQVQVSNDNVNFLAVQMTNVTTGGAAAADMTTNGVYRSSVSGFKFARLATTAAWTGTATVVATVQRQ